MKNVVRFKSTAMIIALISAFSFTACKSDEPSGPNDPSANTEKKTLKALFEGEVSEAVFNSYDFVVNIWTSDEKLLVDNQLTTPEFEYNINLEGTKASSITCQVIATAKKELPEFDAEALYKMMFSTFTTASLIKEDKIDVLPNSNLFPIKNSMSLKGFQIPEYVAKHPSISVMDVTYNF